MIVGNNWKKKKELVEKNTKKFVNLPYVYVIVFIFILNNIMKE